MNHRSQECHWWGRIWSIWWDSSFCHLDDQAKNTISQQSSVLAQRPPWKSQEFQKTKTTMKSSKIIVWNMLNIWKYDHLCENLTSIGYLCEICWMCENIIICVKIWLSLVFVWNILNVWKYDHLCKNLSFIGYLCEICSICENFDFHWIFVWNMLNVWKYGHLCKNLTFIGYLCEIYSMCENMAIWCLGSISDVCAVSEALCSVSNGHYTEPDNCSISGEEKGRHALITCVSYLRKRETHNMWAHLHFT
jgi:hypothetical protein